MVQENAVCQMSIKNSEERAIPITENSLDNTSIETRKIWVATITKLLFVKKSDAQDWIRDLNLVLSLDGTVENLSKNPPKRFRATAPPREYPVRYRLPQAFKHDNMSTEDSKNSKELFAAGSLYYNLMSGKELLHDLGNGKNDETTIQSRFENCEFPDDTWGLPMVDVILGCWCPEFLTTPSKATGPSTKKKVLTCLAIAGGTIAVVSTAVVPVLGLIGFSAIGPVAGSMSAAWQASIGLVQAGSIFAWCQSVAMGGVVLGGLSTGLSGAGVAIVALIANEMDSPHRNLNGTELRERFLEVCRKQVLKDE